MQKIIRLSIFSLLISFGFLGLAKAQTVCTADAFLCPDGRYVGRTGSNCQFVCANSTSTVPVPNPTNPKCPNINSNLYWGLRNTNVTQLHSFLAEYYGVSVTGKYFDNKTVNLVRKFQKENGVSQTGFVGSKTRAKILERCVSSTIGICTKEYRPVCAQTNKVHECCGGNAPAYCATVRVACEVPTKKTFSNTCTAKAAGATVLHEGTCEEPVVNNVAPNNCKVWYDGCNTCSRSTIGGAMACTMMACIQGGSVINPPYCREYFPTATTNAPVISSFSGPISLNINQKGTWKLDVRGSIGDTFNYDINWGDELYARTMSASLPYFENKVTQNNSLEHTYTRAGKYTIRITVTNQNGQTTTTTTSVEVLNGTMGCHDAGVYYNEGTSISCKTDTNGYKACITDAAYYCRGGEWKIEGYYWGPRY